MERIGSTASSSSPRRRRRPRVAELGSAWVGIAAAVGLTTLRTVNADPPDDSVLAVVAFCALIATPGLLALLAARRRPSLYLASGVTYLPMSFLSFAGVTLPLLLVGAMAFTAYGRHSEEETPAVWAPLSALVVFILTIGAACLALFLSDDERCVVTSTSTSCTSDVITNLEAFLSLGAIGLTLGVGWLMARPRAILGS